MALNDGSFPWDTEDTSGTRVLPEVYDDPISGLRYQLDTNGRRIYLPAAPKDTAPRVTVNPADTTGAWSIQYDANGNGFKINKITGEVIPLDFDKTPGGLGDPRDKNSDGIDDSTRMAVGVFADKNSSTGYAYYGSGGPIPVYPTGEDARKHGAFYGDETDGAPKLYSGNKIWDPKQGKFVTAPGYETTASGGTQSISIGGSSRAPTAQETAAMNAQKAASDLAKIQAQAAAQASGYQEKSNADIATEKAKAALERELMLLEYQLKNDPNNPELQLKYQQLALQQQQLEMSNRNAYEDRQLRMVDSFRSAISDVDPAAYRAWLYPQGMGQGGNIANRLSEGGNALSDAANAGAAALLAKIRTPYQSVYQQIAGLPSPGTGAPVTGGLGAITPGAGTTGAPAPTGTGTGLGTITPGLRPDGLTEAQAAANYLAQREQSIAARNAGNAELEANRLVSALPYEAPQQPWEADANAYNYGAWAAALAPRKTDTLGQVWGGSAQTMDPNMPNYRDPRELAIEQAIASGRMAPPPGNLENDQISRELPTRAVVSVAGDSAGQALDPRLFNPDGTPNGIDPKVFGYPEDKTAVRTSFAPGQEVPDLSKTYQLVNGQWVPGLARGTHVPHAGPAIVGDPQRPGVPNPEMVTWTPRGNIVQPLGGMNGRMMRGLRGRMPMFAQGTQAPLNEYLAGNTFTRNGTAVDPRVVKNTFDNYTTYAYNQALKTDPNADRYAAYNDMTGYGNYLTNMGYTIAPVATPVGSTSTATSPAPTTSTAAPSTASPSASSSTTAPAAGSTTAPQATNLGQIQPNATVQQVVNTPSGAVTAPDSVTAQQIQEIADWRTSQLDPMFASTSPYSLALADAGPTTYQGYLANYQTARGIPQGDFDAEIRKWRIKGLSRDAVLAATGV